MRDVLALVVDHLLDNPCPVEDLHRDAVRLLELGLDAGTVGRARRLARDEVDALELAARAGKPLNYEEAADGSFGFVYRTWAVELFETLAID